MEGKEALQIISDLRTDQVVVTTMSTSREWPSFSKREELDLPLLGLHGQGFVARAGYRPGPARAPGARA